MKTPHLKIVTPSLFILLLGSGLTALAQPDRGGPPAPSGRARPEFAGQPPGPGRFSPALERILGILTEEQRLSFRENMEQQRERVRAVEERLMLARRDLVAAALEEKFDERKVREIADGTAKLEADLSVLFLRALARVRPPLTPGQIEKAKQPPMPGMGQPDAPQRRRPDVPRDDRGQPLPEAPPPRTAPSDAAPPSRP